MAHVLWGSDPTMWVNCPTSVLLTYQANSRLERFGGNIWEYVECMGYFNFLGGGRVSEFAGDTQ